MSRSVEFEAANITLPIKNISTLLGAGSNSGKIACIASIMVGTGSTSTDLTTLFGGLGKGHYLTFQADGSKVYVALGAVAGTIDSTATGVGATVCWPIPDGTSLSGRLLSGRRVPTGQVATMTFHTILHHQAVATCTLRIYLSSVDDGQGTEQFPVA
ncbi:MAG: hypothetical protein EPO32_14890 [Anaerolineae bacterium]|nr:MAG: hypothetical protein EPO32_14890 [Anaerolineae bacterium]